MSWSLLSVFFCFNSTASASPVERVEPCRRKRALGNEYSKTYKLYVGCRCACIGSKFSPTVNFKNILNIVLLERISLFFRSLPSVIRSKKGTSNMANRYYSLITGKNSVICGAPGKFQLKLRRKDFIRQMSDLTDSSMKERPFKDMPGPKSFPFIGTLWNYLPLIGKYRMDRLHRNGALKLAEFGSVVREEIVPGTVIVWLFDPIDIEQLFRVEGRFPCRRSHLAIEKYRMDRPNIYKSGGLLPTNGPEWWRLRSAFQRDLSRVSSVRAYLPNTNTVLKEFIHHIEEDYMNSVKGDPTHRKPRDFLQSLSSLFLELTCLVAFDEKLGSLSKSNSAGDSMPNQLIKAALDTNSCILSTDNGPQIWKYMETPLYKKLRKSQEIMERAAVKFVLTKKAKMTKKITSEQKSLLEIYLSSPDLEEKDVIGMAMDMLLAGVDTATYTTGFCLYHLSTNPEKQELLHKEAVKLLPNKGKDECCPIITDEVLSQANYTKAVLKESLRLNPVSVGVGRILPCDTVFSGYSVPKGTVVVTQNQVSCRLEKYFKEPNKFLPERWIRGSDHYQKPSSPYLLLPFGHGPRTCIARRLAEQNIQALLLRVARDFKVIWMGKPDLDCVSLLINKPDQPLLFKFNRRAVS